MAVLNGAVCDSYSGEFEAGPERLLQANKQFIAPLPISNISPEAQSDVAGRRGSYRSAGRITVVCCRRPLNCLSVLARARHPTRWLSAQPTDFA